MNSFFIGNVEIEKTAALAPMASVADKSYRLMCKEYGASYLVSEMISSKGLCFGDKKTARLCEIESEERPYALQLFGEDPYYMGKAAYKLNEYSPDIIDINMGCPVPKIVGNGSGSALMKLPDTAAEICREVVKNADCPVTVKFRAGWDENSINAVEFAKLMEQAGASAVTCHGRTRTQFYSGKADWDIIKQVKTAVKIPVIGNGDVVDGASAKAMYEQTGCDLVMIGRASYGNPFIFDEIKAHFEGREYIPPSPEKKMQIMLEHIRLILKFSEKPEEIAIREARKISAWYMNGYYGCAKFRVKCYSLESYSQAENLAEEFLKIQKEHLL
ncbi:MAG TPA: tRNA dihydrouridine synthase DusB [Ruminococcus sp.]|nr:tRNA dihydrouridine synthase DusB [Ruminococcus sp.]